ncbi:hypothetical protein QBC41DRAFT_148013 [Cercophora samala]|uniref:Uncharacterized protein n=1 Tax=Cercophora samala TaxID=330535 RepID=A0AA39Z9W1_9PEZI|nr:hypothetical protein QBC41DRAFT_148013 [Cercophora samala]
MPTLPTRFWRWKKAAAVLLLQLTPVAWALVHPRLEHINKASIDGHANNRSQAAISTRQDEGIVGDGTPMGLDCLYRCTWATCGAAACALNRRGLISYPTVDAQTHENATSGLHKRVFNREFPKWSPLHIDYYMRTNLGYDRLRADPQFLGVGDYHMLINEWSHEKTVAKERRMPDPNGRAFQIGTNMVHGCTVVALVSNRAVWMAHFWEVSAMNADDEDFRYVGH